MKVLRTPRQWGQVDRYLVILPAGIHFFDEEEKKERRMRAAQRKTRNRKEVIEIPRPVPKAVLLSAETRVI